MSSTSLYHKTLKEALAKELKIAKEARRKGFDPAPAPEINITKDLAERVEALIGIKGLSARIRELEREGYGREEIALRIGYDFVEGRFGNYKKLEVIENAVRTAVAILTEGVVAAPIEGIARVEAGRNDDASEYIKIFYSGPIRSAGGTAQALSVLAADYIRRVMGFAAYHPREEEIGRYVLEVSEYERVSGLQYTPTDEEVKEIVRNCPICIDGDPTEEIEVGGYKDLERVATDKIRGGMVLVLTEGIAMKAAKIKQQVERLELEGWEWLATLVKSKGEKRKKDFLADLIAGRPVFGRPSAKGSFRLRYGRARNSGLSAVGINPATMSLLEFIAAGTQIKPELPRKGNCVVPVDSIEGPTVLLKDGSLVRCGALPHDPASPVRALDSTQTFGTFDPTALHEEVAEIVDLGEILIDYGDFLETNHRLVPGAYAHEWWLKELEVRAKDEAEKWRSKTPSQAEALEIASRFAVPLHPAYTYLWEDLTDEDKEYVAERICQAGILDEKTLFIPDDDGGRIKRILEDLLVPHQTSVKKGFLAIDEPSALLRCLGLNEDLKRDESVRIKTRNKAPTRIGVRMGRPEKSRERRMKPAPHSIFPLGEYGGKNRSLKEALKAKVIEVELQTLGGIDQHITKNRNKGRDDKRSIDLWGYYQETMQQLGEDYTNTNKLDVKCVKGLISKQKVAEHLGKGILRAKHDVVVFKDGTIRYDLTNLPLTHFKPKELGLSVAKAKELGYLYDLNGEELKSDTQIVELKQQDVIISVDAAPYMLKVSHFVDSLLSQFYGLPPYYCASSKEDLVGQLVLGLAPHTSAGILGRIIGFTNASACYAHPFFHAAKRRNCLSPNTEVLVMNSGGLKSMDLESLYRGENSHEEVVDDFGTTRKEVEGIKTYALNTENGRFELKEIKSVIKTPAPLHLVRVRTKSGREFASSPEHRTVVWSNGRIRNKKLLELDDEDRLLVPESLDLEEEDIEEIDLLKEFLKFDNLSRDVMVRGVSKVVEMVVKELGGIKSAAEQIGIGRKTFSNYVYRDSIPLPTFASLLRLSRIDWHAVPKDCKLGVKRDHTAIPRIIKLDESFMRLIGYYLAEGYARSLEKGFYQISMASYERELLEDMEKCIRDVLGIVPSRKEGVLAISSRLIYLLFVEVLGIGKSAKEKRMPSLLRSFPRHKIKWLLSAYFSGNGSVETDKLNVTCSSVSKKLLQDIGLQLLRFGIFFRLKTERKAAGGAAKKFYEQRGKKPVFDLHSISIRSTYAIKFGEAIGFLAKRKNEALKSAFTKERTPRVTKFGDVILDAVKEIEPGRSEFVFLYDIEVEGHHNFLVNNFVLSANCDGDEDSLILLLDALLNFSLSFLPEKRGGRMDAPLVLIPFINPKEVDKEAHNISIASEYPLEFYEAACSEKHPKEVVIGTVSNKIGNMKDIYGFGYTHETTDIAAGPLNSLYKRLATMIEKMEAQLRLARMIRAVDEKEVAETVIKNHFIRDIKGNLRTFGAQKMRCSKCNAKYRRIPLSGRCQKCGSQIVPTVHAAGIKKYLDVSLRIANEYHVSDYTRQRLELLQCDIDTLFPADERQKSLSDFM
ncbi:MAG: DNA polymerase II large subunit [archaeon]|nr:DNA polymerase II large subunit [archaeon]